MQGVAGRRSEAPQVFIRGQFAGDKLLAHKRVLAHRILVQSISGSIPKNFGISKKQPQRHF
jgi:hypothetical protein